MGNKDNNTERRKGQHLRMEDRILIEIRKKEKKSNRAIARELNCSPSTIANELKRGKVNIYNGQVSRYKAKVGQATYKAHRENSRNSCKVLKVRRYIVYVEEHQKEDSWSFDASYGRAQKDGEFDRSEMVCVKTLYNYADRGLIGVKNIDLPQKLRRRPKRKYNRENKRELGRSIEERPAEIEKREEFGHWEADLVIGGRDGQDDVLLVLLERKSRNYGYVRLKSKESSEVMKAMNVIRDQLGERFSRVFKTITTDNGSEFAELSKIEELSETLVYYAHPFSSCEKGSIENHNGMLRRFLPKGKRIEDYGDEALEEMFMICNQLPRKILGYQTPEEVFEKELDAIYAA